LAVPVGYVDLKGDVRDGVVGMEMNGWMDRDVAQEKILLCFFLLYLQNSKANEAKNKKRQEIDVRNLDAIETKDDQKQHYRRVSNLQMDEQAVEQTGGMGWSRGERKRHCVVKKKYQTDLNNKDTN